MQYTRSVKLRDIAVMALFAALMVVTQVVLSFLPNIHLVAIFVILAAHRFGTLCFFPIYTFVILEGIIYGFHLWWVAYLYVWSILAAVILLIRKNGSPMLYAIVAAIHGILFGTLCSIPEFVVGGIGYGLSYIVSGLGYDILHCVSNGVIVALLFAPLNNALHRCGVGFDPTCP